jgi:hypothetical protein
MLSVLIDENLDQRILRGLRLQLPNLDYVIVQETKMQSAGDSVVLAWAAEHALECCEMEELADW